MESSTNRLIKIAGAIVKVCRKARIPAYSCRKSKHVYKQEQHLAVLGLMKYMRQDYRGVAEVLELMPRVRKVIGLEQVPHFTTMHKFFQRFKHTRLDRILSRTVGMFETGDCILAIDSTGYSSSYASTYYTRVINGERSIRTHIKSSITVDTGNQIVVTSTSSKSQRNDILDFDELVTRASELVGIGYVVADKGYDSEASHRLVRRKLNARAVIPVRVRERRRIMGMYRRRCAKEFDEYKHVYHRRSLNETVFSVVKRLMGSYLQSRSLDLQIKEVCLKYVVYNMYRYVRCYFVSWMFSTQPPEGMLFKALLTSI